MATWWFLLGMNAGAFAIILIFLWAMFITPLRTETRPETYEEAVAGVMKAKTLGEIGFYRYHMTRLRAEEGR